MSSLFSGAFACGHPSARRVAYRPLALGAGRASSLPGAAHFFVKQERYTQCGAPLSTLAAVPHHPDLQADDRIVTLTSCNPLYSTAERIVAYGVLESWQPSAAGPPAEIADVVAGWEA